MIGFVVSFGMRREMTSPGPYMSSSAPTGPHITVTSSVVGSTYDGYFNVRTTGWYVPPSVHTISVKQVVCVVSIDNVCQCRREGFKNVRCILVFMLVSVTTVRTGGLGDPSVATFILHGPEDSLIPRHCM